MSTMFSWPIYDAALASCRKRATRSALRAKSSRQHLERDALLDDDVLGQVDVAHAAFAELADARDSDRRWSSRRRDRRAPASPRRAAPAPRARVGRHLRADSVAGRASAACAPVGGRDVGVAMPGAAMVSLKRCGAGVGVMRGCEPVAITRGPAGGCGAPGTRGLVVLGSFGWGRLRFLESSFATLPQPQASAPIERQRFQRSMFLTRVASQKVIPAATALHLPYRR